MKKHTIFTFILIAGSALLAAVSCNRAEPEYMPEDNLARVPVTLNLGVQPMDSGTPETKTIMEPDYSVSSNDQIANFVILQFNGVTPSAQLVGGQLYFDHWPLSSEEKVTLVASETPNTVIVLANTFGNIAVNNNVALGTFLENDFTTISSLAGILTTSSGDDYLRLSGSKKLDSVGAGSSVDIVLKRNVAKIIVNVKNSTASNTGDDKVAFDNVKLCTINSKYYYLTHIGGGLDALSFSDPYSSGTPRRFDNDTEEFPAANNTSGATVTYTYYVTPNLRGTTSSTHQYSKGSTAPEGATKFCIYGTYGTSHKPIIYTYYLGGNLTYDFNILPNYKYTYNITVTSKGDSHYDYRIEDFGEDVTFTVDANCYMLQPPEIDGFSRIYSFPVRRIATFWNSPGVNGGVYGANSGEGYSSYIVDSGTEWTAEILWSDFDMTGYMSGENKFLTVDSGKGYAPGHTQPYIKVKVPKGMKGNVVVGLKVSGTILWSWHLWITDYYPDLPMTPVAGKYVYPVKNGSIHRYNNTLFNTAPETNVTGYANGFIMDRNLGALGDRYDAPGSNGPYYEFGRKDPFLDRTKDNQKRKFYLGGTTLTTSVGSSVSERYISRDATGASGSKNVRYAVTHPTMWIYSPSGKNDWTVPSDDLADGQSSSTNYLWNDKKYYEHNGDQDVLEVKKSIYDPCPPGWKVPIRTTWGGFITLSPSNEEAGTYTSVWADNGRYYYPEGYINREETGYAYYPGHGYAFNTGDGTNGYCWSSTPSGASGYHLDFGTTSLAQYYSDGRTFGFPVRCVRE